MIFGHHSYGSISFGSTDDDQSSMPILVDLLGNQDWERSYLLHAQPYDPDTASVVDVYASVGLDKPIVNSLHWPAILRTGCDIQVELFDDGEGGQGRTSFGNIELLIGDEDHDGLMAYYWDGRPVELLMGSPDLDFADYQTMALGTVEDVTYDRRKLTLIFRGKESRLDVPINQTYYSGAGGINGTADLTEQVKPKAYGFVQNITPILVDPVNLIYQWHDGSVYGVYRALDGGADLIDSGDVADITAVTPQPGRFYTQNSGGYIKLGAPVAKVFTLDGFGDSSDGYIDKAADIAKRIILDHTSLTEDDLDLASFYALGKDNRATCGLYALDGTIADWVSRLLESVGAAYSFIIGGLLHVAQFREHRAVGTISTNDIVRESFSRDRTLAPSWFRKFRYRKNWTVMSEDQLVGAADESRKVLSKMEYAETATKSFSIAVKHAATRTVTKDTLMYGQINALSELTRQQRLFGGDYDRYIFTARNQQFKYRPGETINLVYSRWNVSHRAIITSIRENTATKQTQFKVFVPKDSAVISALLDYFVDISMTDIFVDSETGDVFVNS